jgi:hypothetical protein
MSDDDLMVSLKGTDGSISSDSSSLSSSRDPSPVKKKARKSKAKEHAAGAQTLSDSDDDGRAKGGGAKKARGPRKSKAPNPAAGAQTVSGSDDEEQAKGKVKTDYGAEHPEDRDHMFKLLRTLITKFTKDFEEHKTWPSKPNGITYQIVSDGTEGSPPTVKVFYVESTREDSEGDGGSAGKAETPRKAFTGTFKVKWVGGPNGQWVIEGVVAPTTCLKHIVSSDDVEKHMVHVKCRAEQVKAARFYGKKGSRIAFAANMVRFAMPHFFQGDNVGSYIYSGNLFGGKTDKSGNASAPYLKVFFGAKRTDRKSVV